MRASRFVAATLAVAVVSGAVLSFTQGLANASSFDSVCKNTQLSFAMQNRCAQDIKAASSATTRKEVAARYQAMIDTKAAAQQGASTPSQAGPSTPTAQQTQPPSSTTPN